MTWDFRVTLYISTERERERAIFRSIMKDLMINYLPSFLLCLPRFLLLSANVTFASVPVSSIIVRVSFLAESSFVEQRDQQFSSKYGESQKDILRFLFYRNY